VGEQQRPISFSARPAAAIVEEVSMPVRKKPGRTATKSKSKLKSVMKKKAGKKKKK
jgi:hypothetical protein